jgi:hypothetical protein
MGDTNRRRFLQGVGAGSSAGLAGCAALDSGGQDDGSNSTESDTADSGQDAGSDSIPEDGVAVSLALDQAQLQQKQLELSREQRQGNITQSEARSQLLALQRELSTEAVEAFTAQTEDIEITARRLELAIIVVDGPSQSLIDAIQYDSVSALVSTNRVREQLQQQGQG